VLSSFFFFFFLLQKDKYTEGANEELHVYICADTLEKVGRRRGHGGAAAHAHRRRPLET